MGDAAANIPISGLELLEAIATATGLPFNCTQNELHAIIKESNKELDTISLEDVRALLAEYMQEVLLEAQKNYSK